MLRIVQQFFEQYTSLSVEADRATASEHDLKLVTSALMVELIRADFEENTHEKAMAISLLRKVFVLSAEETDELMKLAEETVDASTSLYEFTGVINRQFDDQQKLHIIELLWQVALADGHIDKYEDHLIRRVAELIYVPHSAFIRAKHQVIETAGY